MGNNGWMFKPFIGRGIRSNIATEAAGLKRASESRSQGKVEATPNA